MSARVHLAAWVLLFGATGATASAAEGAERRLAIVVGNNSAGKAREPLRYAARDARQMATVLRSLGGVQTDWILAEGTPSDLRATWSKVQAELTHDPTPTTVFFYYSGHADERGLLMGSERYEFEELRATLQKLPARLFIAVVDACQAAGSRARRAGARCRCSTSTSAPPAPTTRAACS